MLYAYIIEHNLLKVKFLNRMTNEVIENTYMTVLKYVINKHYPFFSTNVMLIVIGITLIAFSFYHFYLVLINQTSHEKSKRSRVIKLMKLVMKTLKNLGDFKNFEVDFEKLNEKDVKLTKEEIKNYKDIVFKSKKNLNKFRS